MVKNNLKRLWKFFKYVVYTVFVVFTDTYAVVITLFLVLRLFFDEFELSILGLFNNMFAWILLPAFVMALGSVYIRRWRLVLFTMPPIFVFVINYGVFFLPNSVDVPDNAQRLSILTYNTKHISQELDALTSTIVDTGADVVLLQEMSSELADYLPDILIDVYPFQSLHNAERILGQGILSRYPIESEDFFEIEGRPGFLYAEIDFDGEIIGIYNVHAHVPLASTKAPRFEGERQIRAIEWIIEHAHATENPVIIAGDMNMTDQFTAYRRISESFDDAYREVGWGLGLTFPEVPAFFFPRLNRLDYVFYSDGLQAIDARVWPDSGGSDHRPVLVTLAIIGD